MIRKKPYGALVDYHFSSPQYPKIGWYAYFTNKPPLFIGKNWVAARDFIAELPNGNPFRRFISNITGRAIKA